MAAPRKYDQEFRDRAVRMFRDRVEETGGSALAARRHVGGLLDLKPDTLRGWVDQAQREAGERPARSVDSANSEEVRTLKKRVAELERANEILKTSAAFFAQAELDRRLK